MVSKKPVTKSHYHKLKRQWLKRHKALKQNLYQKHQEAFDWLFENFPAKDKLAAGAIGALMLAQTMPATSTAILADILPPGAEQKQEQKVDTTAQMVSDLSPKLGEKVRPLNAQEEAEISATLSSYFEMDVKPDIGGLRLNRTWGMIGAEQHLMRYPGDNMAVHLPKDLPNYRMVYSSGMAPGRGAWGYFVKSKAELDDKAVEREKWYIAVQTFAAPNYNGRLSEYRDFFKFRKMLVVNPKTGQAIVCDIADAGPAVWTGKHLGGSPEVMVELGLDKGMRKGGVLYFFIDDPGDTIPLGSVKPYGGAGIKAVNE